MKNSYEIRGEKTVITLRCYGKKDHGVVILETIIDTEKLHDISKYNTWEGRYNKSNNEYYVQVAYKNNKKVKRFFLHRLLMDPPEGMVVDHINKNPLDNRIENLRIITQAQNCQNRKELSSNNKSGVRNVSWNAALSKWLVKIKIHGKSHYFGVYKELEDAKKVADEKRKILFPYRVADDL